METLADRTAHDNNNRRGFLPAGRKMGRYYFCYYYYNKRYDIIDKRFETLCGILYNTYGGSRRTAASRNSRLFDGRGF